MKVSGELSVMRISKFRPRHFSEGWIFHSMRASPAVLWSSVESIAA